MSDDDAVTAQLDAWCRDLAGALGINVGEIDRDAVLALAGRAAHSVVRPAAPLTTYLAGYAAGRARARGEDPAEALAAVDIAVRALTAPENPR